MSNKAAPKFKLLKQNAVSKSRAVKIFMRWVFPARERLCQYLEGSVWVCVHMHVCVCHEGVKESIDLHRI